MNKTPSVSLANHPIFLDTLQLTAATFLGAICHALKDALETNTVFVASLGMVESDYFYVEAISPNRSVSDEFDFGASGTPCEEVIRTGKPVSVCSNVRVAYPNAALLKRLGSEASLGLPLKDTDETTIGVLVLDWTEEVEHSTMQLMIDALAPYLGRISEELKRKTQEHVFPALVNPVQPLQPHSSSNAKTEVFRNIVTQAVVVTKIQTVAIVCRLLGNPGKLRILALYSAGKNVTDLEGQVVDHASIPCSKMIDIDCHLEVSNVLDKYQREPILKRFEVESYLGIGFRDTTGESIGHIAFLHNRPMRDTVKNCDLIQIFASKAGHELQRFVLEQQRDAMEASLRVRSKLESLGTMAGTIAHDFNNQLTTMMASNEMASLALPDSHPAQTFLSNAEQSMWRARDVISEILDFAGNSKSAPLERVSLGEVVGNAISEFKPRLDEHSQIVSVIAPDLPEIVSRRIQIFQIFLNLISNGLDALTEGSSHKITVNVGLVTLTYSERKKCLTGRCPTLPEQCLRAELRDSGRGMNAETAERMFDPYFSTKGVSRGLGLSSVLGIARRMEIGLTFDSIEGVGTAFRLYFAPAEPVESSTDTKDALRPSQTVAFGKTAMVIDDEEAVNDVVSEILALWGWQVIKAYSGEQALTLSKSIVQLDLVFVDVVMPGMNGFETLGELRKTHPALPAVIISGYSENNLTTPVNSDDGIRFLIKPFGAKLLGKTVDELMGASASINSMQEPTV